MWQQLLLQLQAGDRRALARCISLVENEQEGYMAFLQNLPAGQAPVIGITGPPGAGKSSLADALIGALTGAGKKVGVLCVDPSSPFNLGAVLGDRIRMNQWYNHPDVYIRSLASRGSLGGLNQMIIEITAVLQAVGFDYILIETVGIGQSEVEIAGLADTTVVVLVPEAGDEIQTMKAGVMEIADIFVVNKSDRPDADRFVAYLKQMLAPAFGHSKREIPVIKTVAHLQNGIKDLIKAIETDINASCQNDRKIALLTRRVLQIIQRLRMKDISIDQVRRRVQESLTHGEFQVFRLAAEFNHS